MGAGGIKSANRCLNSVLSEQIHSHRQRLNAADNVHGCGEGTGLAFVQPPLSGLSATC